MFANLNSEVRNNGLSLLPLFLGHQVGDIGLRYFENGARPSARLILQGWSELSRGVLKSQVLHPTCELTMDRVAPFF